MSTVLNIGSWLALSYLVVCVLACTYAEAVWAWEHRRGFWPWVRRWNPIYLRGEIDLLGRHIGDDRNLFADDMANTAIERAYRQAAFIRAGHVDPSGEALRYSVKGHTLHIDATDRAASRGAVPVADDDSTDRALGPE